VRLTLQSDTSAHVAETSPIFSQMDLVLGRPSLYQGGEQAIYKNLFQSLWKPLNSGLIFSDGHAPGTIPRNGLAWAFDFYDHGGNDPATWAGITLGFRDLANGSAFLASCQGGQCGNWNPGQGTTLQTFGASIGGGNGYSPLLTSFMHETPQTSTIGATKIQPGGLTPVNAPSSMQGNGTFTVAGVFRWDGGYNIYNKTAFWQTGSSAASNTVGLQFETTTGANLELGWGSPNTDRWRFNSGFTLVPGNWYFITGTVQANGVTPIAHLWMGLGGTLTDKISGVSYAMTGGSPAQTPNVSASPLYLGQDVGWGANGASNTSYASLFVYNRALSQAEVGLMYNTMKAKMAARGVTIQ
jgi:hypothetical protein